MKYYPYYFHDCQTRLLKKRSFSIWSSFFALSIHANISMAIYLSTATSYSGKFNLRQTKFTDFCLRHYSVSDSPFNSSKDASCNSYNFMISKETPFYKFSFSYRLQRFMHNYNLIAIYLSLVIINLLYYLLLIYGFRLLFIFFIAHIYMFLWLLFWGSTIIFICKKHWTKYFLSI